MMRVLRSQFGMHEESHLPDTVSDADQHDAFLRQLLPL